VRGAPLTVWHHFRPFWHLKPIAGNAKRKLKIKNPEEDHPEKQAAANPGRLPQVHYRFQRGRAGNFKSKELTGGRQTPTSEASPFISTSTQLKIMAATGGAHQWVIKYRLFHDSGFNCKGIQLLLLVFLILPLLFQIQNDHLRGLSRLTLYAKAHPSRNQPRMSKCPGFLKTGLVPRGPLT